VEKGWIGREALRSSVFKGTASRHPAPGVKVKGGATADEAETREKRKKNPGGGKGAGGDTSVVQHPLKNLCPANYAGEGRGKIYTQMRAPKEIRYHLVCNEWREVT